MRDHLFGGFQVGPDMQVSALTKLLLDRDLEYNDLNVEVLDKITGSRRRRFP